MLKNLGWTVKCLIGFFVISVILPAVAYAGLGSIGHANTKMRTALEATLPVHEVTEITPAVARILLHRGGTISARDCKN